MKYLIPILLLAVLLGGCGVVLNATYSQLLDQTAAQAANDSYRADANALTIDQMKTAMRYEANAWEMFRAARDGR